MVSSLTNLSGLNGRFVPAFARTMLGGPRDASELQAFQAHVAERAYEFTDAWADNNIAYIAPILRRWAEARAGPIGYLEIGAYEGRNLAFMDHLLPGRLDVAVIDPWFDPALNPEPKYLEVEPRFHRNAAKLGFRSLRVHKGFSTYLLPERLAAGDAFDLIYVDGSHTAWAVMIDLCFCAALLRTGGLLILDDYWHDESEIGGPGVKQAVDRFHGAFRDYFELEAVYRQVVLRKTAAIPR